MSVAIAAPIGITVTIPLYNEAENIPILYEREVTAPAPTRA